MSSSASISGSASVVVIKPKKLKKKTWCSGVSWISLENLLIKQDLADYETSVVQNWDKINRNHEIGKKKQKKQLHVLTQMIGPIWYQELSNPQRKALDALGYEMHMDGAQGISERTQVTLDRLGIFPGLKSTIVWSVLKKSEENPVSFMWELYKVIFNKDPTVPEEKYTMEARLLLSAIVHLCEKDLIANFEEILRCNPEPSIVVAPPKPPKKKICHSCYLLSPMNIPVIPTKMYDPKPLPKKAGCLPDLKSFFESTDDGSLDDAAQESKMSLALSLDDIHKKESKINVIGSNQDLGVKKKGNVKYEDITENPSQLTTRPVNPCDASCKCVQWYPLMIKYINEILEPNEEKVSGKRRQRKPKPKKNNVFQDKMKNLAAKLVGGDIKPMDILVVLLAEQAFHGNYVAQLPNAHLIPVLREWARKRILGEYTVEENTDILRKEMIQWNILRVMKAQIKSPSLPFTKEELRTLNWRKKDFILKMVKARHDAFYKQIRRMLVAKSRIWWPTMEIEKFPNKSFRDMFFSYMPARELDIQCKNKAKQ